MAITYGSGPGTIVTTAAVNETIGDQSQQTGSNTIVLSDDFVTLSNGNHGADTYPTRLCLIREGDADEEELYIVSEVAGTGNTYILTVAGDWTDVPASGDTVHISYNAKDAATLGGVSFDTRSGIYEANNKLTIGNATDFAYFALLDGDHWQMDDSRSATDPFLVVENNGRFNSGYLLNGIPVQGGKLDALNNADGEDTIEYKSGAIVRLYDHLTTSPINDTQQLSPSSATTDALMQGSKVVKMAYEQEWYDWTIIDSKIQGTGNANDYLRMDAGTTVDGLILIYTAGLASTPSDTTTETITIAGYVPVRGSDLITLQNNKTWNMVDPAWTATTSSDFEDTAVSGSATVNDKRSIEAVVQEADGTKLQDALVNIYENTQLADLVQELTTDVNGEASGTFIYKAHIWTTGTGATTTYGGHALQCGKWLYLPFVAAQISTDNFDGTIVLAPDGNIVQTTQATAKSAGSTITWNDETNPSSIIKYTGGSGTLSVGNTVTGGTSGADGVVTQIVDGNSVAGTIHLKTRDAVDFSGTEGLSNGAGWTATLTASSQQDFSIWIDCQTLSLQTVYDYEAAIQNETTLTADGEKIWEWCRSAQTQPVYATGSSFYTEQSNSKGVFLVDAGAGTIDYMTDDADVQYVPPASVTLSMTVKNKNTGVVIANVSCAIYKTSDDTELLNSDTNGSGVATAAYTYTGDTDIYWRVRESPAGADRYFPDSGLGLIEASGFTTTVLLRPLTIS